MYMKKFNAFLLAAMLLLSVMLFAACGGEGGSSTEAPDLYQVKVVDALGNPYTDGVIVRFMQNGQQTAMQVIDSNGVAAKDLADGEYGVELQFTNTDVQYHYDCANVKLTADNKSAEVVLSYALDTSRSESLNALSLLSGAHADHAAYHIGVGCTYAALTAGERNYFVFAPANGGTYEFSVANSDAVIGYYGATHFVQDTNVAENVTEKGFVISISNSMVGGVLVIGVDATGESKDAVISIQRTGEPQATIEDLPWTVYEATVELAEYTLPSGTQLNDFDIKASTDTYKLVYNETDGFYHLDSADGALVLVRLGNASGGSKYLDSFEQILDRSGLSRYFADESGKIVKRESYSECMLEYIEHMDEESGLYPLTEDLKYIIQNRGIHSGWFEPDSNGYLFDDDNYAPIPGINNEISWLFCCVYTG